MIWLYLCIFFISVFFTVYVDLRINKIFLSPAVISVFPLSIALLLYLLGLSEYYLYETIDLVFLVTILFAYYVGCISFNIISGGKETFRVESDNFISTKNLERVIKFTMYMAVFVFLLESFVQTPPLLSDSKTQSYLNFGLPIIHHFIGLLKVNIVLTFLLFKLSGKKKLLLINLFLCLVMYSMIMARMMILNAILILFFSYNFYIKKINIKKVIVIIIIIFTLFLIMFVLLGNLRIGDEVGNDYIYNLGKINQNQLPSFLVLPYIYMTVGFQNLLNLIHSNESNYFGMYSLFNSIPLFKTEWILNNSLVDFQVSRGLTTFIFGKSFVLDFKYLAPFFSFIFGSFCSLIFLKTKSANIFFKVFYISYILPVILFAFFSDAFFSSSLIIYIIYIFTITKFIKIKRK